MPSPAKNGAELQETGGGSSQPTSNSINPLSTPMKSMSEAVNSTLYNKETSFMEVTFQRYENSATYNFTQSEIGRIVGKILKVPKAALKAVDDSNWRGLMIVFNPGYNATEYMLAESRTVKTGVRMKHILHPDREIWVKLYWTGLDTMILMKQLWMYITSEMSYMEFPEGEDEDAD